MLLSEASRFAHVHKHDNIGYDVWINRLHLQDPATAGRQAYMPWTFVVAGIATFVLQYAASGALEAPLLHQYLAGLPLLDLLLATTALLHWCVF